MEPHPTIRIPLRAVLIDVVGAVICGYGVYGLVEPAGPAAPPIALAAVAALMGAGLMVYALLTILRRIREQVRGRTAG